MTPCSQDVRALNPNPRDPVPFMAPNTAGSRLLIFIAAYGGLPLDYRTNPPTIDFTSQANVDAIRQVLDLARNGYINYSALSNLDFGGGQNNLQTAIYTSNLNAFNRRPQTAQNGISVAAFAGGGGASTTFLIQHWLYEAFDNYVLNNADLQSSLNDDEAFAKAFLACAEKIPPFDPSTQNKRTYNQQFASCATTV